jgi:hypothetical protein
MRIFPPPLDIAENEGFTAAKDIFGRREFGEGLANLLAHVQASMVIALDAQWGSGKTTFLKMWAGHLRNSQFPVVYFDAFESDYIEDPFSAVAGQIIALAQEQHKENEAAAQRFLTKAFGAGRVLLRSGIKIAVKAGTLGAIDTAGFAAELGEAVKDIATEARDIEDKYLGEMLTRQREQKGTIEAFREALADLPGLLQDSPADGQTPKPLIFIIDELDRCRPLFALQTLERIKHFFSVRNVHFVLGTHIEQLQASVAAAYGASVDANAYLQKFIHLTFPLVDRARFPNERAATKYAAFLAQALEFEPPDRELATNSAALVGYVAHHRGLSLRAVERIMSAVAVALAFTTERHLRPAPIIAGLCILRVVAPGAYAKAKLGTLTHGDFSTALGVNLDVTEPGEQVSMDWFRDYWRYALEDDPPRELIERYSQGLFRYNIGERRELVTAIANKIVDRLALPAPTA